MNHPKPRRVIGVAEVRVPATSGEDRVHRWRGAMYADGAMEFWTGDELADLFDLETWAEDPAPPEQVRVALEFLCCWRALPEHELPPEHHAGVA